MIPHFSALRAPMGYSQCVSRHPFWASFYKSDFLWNVALWEAIMVLWWCVAVTAHTFLLFSVWPVVVTCLMCRLSSPHLSFSLSFRYVLVFSSLSLLFLVPFLPICFLILFSLVVHRKVYSEWTLRYGFSVAQSSRPACDTCAPFHGKPHRTKK